MALSQRLLTVASMVSFSTMADIGTDHALLPLYLVETGKVKKAIAVEVHEGPFHKACEAVRRREMQQHIEVRFGDGLEPLQEGEVETVVMAGMGGATMVDILSHDLQKTGSFSQLVLQPNNQVERLRAWLYQHHWSLKQERWVEEGGHWYPVLSALPGGPDKAYVEASQMLVRRGIGPGFEEDPFLYYLLGPLVLLQGGPELVGCAREEAHARRRILQQMNQARSGPVQKKRLALESELKQLEVLASCWQRDRW